MPILDLRAGIHHQFFHICPVDKPVPEEEQLLLGDELIHPVAVQIQGLGLYSDAAIGAAEEDGHMVLEDVEVPGRPGQGA